jgi:hypothetical protein
MSAGGEAGGSDPARGAGEGSGEARYVIRKETSAMCVTSAAAASPLRLFAMMATSAAITARMSSPASPTATSDGRWLMMAARRAMRRGPRIDVTAAAFMR